MVLRFANQELGLFVKPAYILVDAILKTTEQRRKDNERVRQASKGKKRKNNYWPTGSSRFSFQFPLII